MTTPPSEAVDPFAAGAASQPRTPSLPQVAPPTSEAWRPPATDLYDPDNPEDPAMVDPEAWRPPAGVPGSGLPRDPSGGDRSKLVTPLPRRARDAAEEAALLELEGIAKHYARVAEETEDSLKTLFVLEVDAGKQALLERYDKSIEVHLARSRSLRAKAIARYEDFLKLHPNDASWTPEISFRLAELYFEASNERLRVKEEAWEKQVAAIEKQQAEGKEVGDLPPSPKVDYDKSVDLFRRVAADFPRYAHNDAARYMMGLLLYEQEDFDAGRQALLSLVCADRFAVPDASQSTSSPRPRCAKATIKAVPRRARAAASRSRAGCASARSTTTSTSSVLRKRPTPRLRPIPRTSSTTPRSSAGPGPSTCGASSPPPSSASMSSSSTPIASREPMMDRARPSTAMRPFVTSPSATSSPTGTSTVSPTASAASSASTGTTRTASPSPTCPRSTRPSAASGPRRTTWPWPSISGSRFCAAWPNSRRAPQLQMRLFETYSQLQERDKARSARDNLATNYLRGTEWYYANENDTEAIEDAMKLAEDALVAVAVDHHERAQQLRVAGDPKAQTEYEIASRAYSAYLERFPDTESSYEYRFQYADTLYFSGKYVEAAQQFTAVRDSNLDNRLQADASSSVLASLESYAEKEEQSGRFTMPEMPKQGAQGPFDAQQLPPLVLALQEAYDRHVAIRPDAEDAPETMYKAAALSQRYYNFDEAEQRFLAVLEQHCDNNVAINSGYAIIDSYIVRGDLAQTREWTEKLAGMGCGEGEAVPSSPVTSRSSATRCASKRPTSCSKRASSRWPPIATWPWSTRPPMTRTRTVRSTTPPSPTRRSDALRAPRRPTLASTPSTPTPSSPTTPSCAPA